MSGPHPKPEPRRRDPGLLALLKLEHDECELSGETFPLHLHHVVFKSHGGDDVRANIVCMLDDLHTRYHGADEQVRGDLAWYVMHNRPDTIRYLNKKLIGGFDEWFRAHTKQMSIEDALKEALP